ncbi:MAG TPA: cupin domain-containing protein [Burkholderiaceae bacterium]|nr:cupin domain-containing protein [Burkholderiaceae bacterium]
MHILDSIGEISVDDFMRRHWQRRPLLVRAALPGFVSPLPPARLFELAARDDVESRLVSSADGRWRLEHGPFERLPPRRRPGWTLLVQGTDLHDDAAHALLQRFRFVPDARLDDLMASFATDGGGVGPHVDSYDVFLLQAHGTRRWRVAPPGDATLVPGMPLKLLARFEPAEEWLLEPGDMLYVPPGWGHEGTAVGECVTLSIGFRAPSRREFLAAFLAAAADAPGGPDPRFADRGRAPSARPGELPDDLAERLAGWARDWRPAAADVERFVGEFLTEPKPSVWFDAPERPLAGARFAAVARRDGLRLDRRSRMACRGARAFVNGEAFAAAGPRRWLRRLADRRVLTAAECARAFDDPALAAMLHRWYEAGWLHPAADAPSARA